MNLAAIVFALSAQSWTLESSGTFALEGTSYRVDNHQDAPSPNFTVRKGEYGGIPTFQGLEAAKRLAEKMADDDLASGIKP